MARLHSLTPGVRFFLMGFVPARRYPRRSIDRLKMDFSVGISLLVEQTAMPEVRQHMLREPRSSLVASSLVLTALRTSHFFNQRTAAPQRGDDMCPITLCDDAHCD